MTALAVTTMASLSAAHPGEKHHLQDVKRQVDTMHSMASHAKRSLDACSSTLKHRELMQRSEERRSQIVQNLRRKRGIEDSRFRTFFPRQETLLTQRRAAEIPPRLGNSRSVRGSQP